MLTKEQAEILINLVEEKLDEEASPDEAYNQKMEAILQILFEVE